MSQLISEDDSLHGVVEDTAFVPENYKLQIVAPPETDAVVMVENMRLIKSNKDREEELEVEILTKVTPGQTHGEVRSHPRARRGRTPGCCGGDPGPDIKHAGGLHAILSTGTGNEIQSQARRG